MLADLIDHPEHGLTRLRGDFYAQRRAVSGGIILASALLLGMVLAQIVGGSIGRIAQIALTATGFSFALITAAWPNNPRQAPLGVLGGAGVFVLLGLGAGLVIGALIFLIAFIPQAAGGLPTVGGSLLGLLAVLFGGIAGVILVLGVAAIITIAGFITLSVAAGAGLDDELVNETVKAVTNKKRFFPALAILVGAALLAIAGAAVISVGTQTLLDLNSGSKGMGDLGAGLYYLIGIQDVGVLIASTGDVDLTGLVAGIVTVVAAAFVLGLLLAAPLAIAARGILIHMRVGEADFTVARAASLRTKKPEKTEPLPTFDDEEDLDNLDLREAVERPANWNPQGGRASDQELLQVRQRGTDYELDNRGNTSGSGGGGGS